MKNSIDEMVSRLDEREGPLASGRYPASHNVGKQLPGPLAVRYTQTRQVNVSFDALRKNRVLIDCGVDSVAMAYKMLRTQVLNKMSQNGWNVLAVTSARQGEGKTLTSINLAINLARDVNHTVMLVDLDLRKPSIHQYFEIDPLLGIADYLSAETQLSDILINPGIERLVILPGRHKLANSSEMLSSPRMRALIEELRSRYPKRIILLDMPPLLCADDMLMFAPYIDAVLFVVAQRFTHKEDLNTCAELMSGINVIGTVMNMSHENVPTYY